MKTFKKLISISFCLLMLFSFVVPCAAASETTAAEVLTEFIETHASPYRDHLSIGYRNLVTGEEFLYNPDLAYESASLYKVPLNMYWANQVYLGNITFDETVLGVPLSTVQKMSLKDSDNNISGGMIDKIGSFEEYRTAIAPYYGLTEQDLAANPHYVNRADITLRYMINCMQTLYDAPEEFPGVLDSMKEADPQRYFRKYDESVPIAQKYGYVITYEDGEHFHTTGIVFTEEPFILVFLSNYWQGHERMIGALSQTLIEYTKAQTGSRAASSMSSVTFTTETLGTDVTPEPTATPAPTPTATPEATAAPTENASPVSASTPAPTAVTEVSSTAPPDAAESGDEYALTQSTKAPLTQEELRALDLVNAYEERSNKTAILLGAIGGLILIGAIVVFIVSRRRDIDQGYEDW